MGLGADLHDPLRAAWPLLSAESDFVPIGPWNTDGLIIVNPLHSPARSRYVQELRAAGFPVLFIAAGEAGPAILPDNRGGILAAMRHLVTHGHRCIAFIAGSPEDDAGDSGERLRAYYDALALAGLPVEPRLTAWGRHTYAGGYAAAQTLLAAGAPFTALLASNDESALGALAALREAGRRAPDDIALIGFDDRLESGVHTPPLTSVRVPLLKMGYRAAETLAQYLTGQTGALGSERVPVSLIVRESCGCAPSCYLPGGSAGLGTDPMPLAAQMAAVLLDEAQTMVAAEVECLCREVTEAFSWSIAQGASARFHTRLAAAIEQTAARGDDVYIWDNALALLETAWHAAPEARALLEQARAAISAGGQQQYRQHIVERRWMLNRLGVLNARLLAARDEAEVYAVLAQHLPAMDIRAAWIALFAPEGDDPAAWSVLRAGMQPDAPAQRAPSRNFPPPGLLPPDVPFSLALFPLLTPRGQLGFVAFDAAHLDLYGTITQQIATALHSAQLYREAMEGRRLAEEANALKSRFLSTVSHELRAPLNLVVGLSGILLQQDAEDASLPDARRKDLDPIYASAQHLGGLIGDVLDLASSDAGQLRLNYALVDLSAALRLTAEIGERLAAEKGLAWRVDIPASGPWVWGDRTRLRQLALNLISNAVKFTARGEVRLALAAGPTVATVTVADTGLGIPSEEQAFIFDEFRRSERSVARGYSGLGLGLAICKRLAELHGGTIGVHSSGVEGEGATFYITLPVVQPPALEQASRDSGRILLLTQRAAADLRLPDQLAARGFEVQLASVHASPDWLAQLAAAPPGAILIDVSADPLTGWQLLKMLKGQPHTQHLPVLFCALSTEGGALLELDYLTKPIAPTALARALDEHRLSPEGGRELKTVLVVDDDSGARELHARITRSYAPNYRILQARDGLEALACLQQEAVDLVLLDLLMPGLDGFGVLEAMRAQDATRKTPVIVVTGQVLTESDMLRLSQGVATVLSKGMFSFEETLTHIGAALERARKLSSEAQRLVRQAMAYIHAHYAEPLARADIARHVALSDDYLTFCFRKELGITPIAYLNRFRVGQARRLLTETTRSIAEIALEVGFTDSSYFSRVFRREVGMTPDAFRQS